jgi:hypothetical protein
MIIKPLDLDISNIIKTASLCMNRLYMMMNMYIYVYIYIFYQTAVRCFPNPIVLCVWCVVFMCCVLYVWVVCVVCCVC